MQYSAASAVNVVYSTNTVQPAAATAACKDIASVMLAAIVALETVALAICWFRRYSGMKDHKYQITSVHEPNDH
jgi:hypothetical protein